MVWGCGKLVMLTDPPWSAEYIVLLNKHQRKRNRCRENYSLCKGALQDSEGLGSPYLSIHSPGGLGRLLPTLKGLRDRYIRCFPGEFSGSSSQTNLDKSDLHF